MDKLITGRAYESLCGSEIAFSYAVEYICEHTQANHIANLKIAVVSDREVSGYYYSSFEKQFLDKGVTPVLVPVEAKNAGKCLSSVDKVYRYLIDFDFSSQDWIIGFGGGGVIDVAGFAASVFYGGINYMAVPTTLNAMTEGAIASMAFLNCASHKDVINTSFKPSVVICDPSFLSSVPQKTKSNGMAAVIRYAILADPALLDEVVDIKDFRLFLNKIYASRAKVEAIDPRLLALGTELGLAIEGYFRFMNYSEGEALALSLYSFVSDSGRKLLDPVYSKLKLPNRVEGVTKTMLIKTLREQLCQRYGEVATVVDLDEDKSGRFVVRSLEIDDCMKIFEKRINNIFEG